MDSFLVTGEDSDELIDGYGKSRKPSFSYRYTEILDEECSTYLMAGMSYDDYWNGPAEMVLYYKKKLKKERDYANFQSWLQGLYIYEAILNLSPVLKPFVKNPEVIPYREKPIPLTKAEIDKMLEEQEMARVKANREKMEQMLSVYNRRFKENQKKGGE